MSAAISVSVRKQKYVVFLYAGCLLLVNSLAAPSGIPAIPLQFYQKDHLHLTPSEIALFGLITGIPIYLGGAFGFLRDRWSPFRLGDRGHFLFFTPLIAAVYLWLSSSAMTWSRLLAGSVLASALWQAVFSAQGGLIATIAQRDKITGAISALSTSLATLAAVAAPLLGGWLAPRMGMGVIYPLTALGPLLIFILGLWKARPVFENLERIGRRPSGKWSEIKRLVCHRPLWPTLLIGVLWQFAPGFGTPLFFHLTITIGLRAESYGQFLAAFNIALLAVMALYGVLCQRIAFSRLLWWGTLLAIPQMLLLLCIHTPQQAILCAVLMGTMAGTAAAAYFDLLIRSCPPGLEGTAMMLANGLNFLVIRGADVFGAWLYQQGSFPWCVLLTVAVCACILPALPLVPRSILLSTDRE